MQVEPTTDDVPVLDAPGENPVNEMAELISAPFQGLGTVFELEGDDAPVMPTPDEPSEQPTAETPAGDPAPEPLFKVDGDAVIIKGQRLEGEALNAAAEAAINFTSNQQKFRAEQQAWEAERTQREQQFQPLIEAAQFISTLPQESQEYIFQTLDEVGRAAQRGETYTPSKASQPAPVLSGTITLPGGQQVEISDLSDEAQAVLGLFQAREKATLDIINRQNAVLQRLETQVNDVGSVIPEVKTYLGQVKGDKEAEAAAADIKANYGVDVTPAQLRQIQQETGVNDMEAAFLKANRGAPPKPSKQPPKTPTGQSRQVELGNLTTDQYARRVAQGQI